MIKTRKPTGKPAWPIILLAGVEKSGKTYAAAEASGSDLIGRTYWLTCGEDDPDEYAPLGRFEIVEQPGTHRALVESIKAITADETGSGKPNLIVLDSGSMLWSMLSDEAQQTANTRKKRDDADVTPDLWNTAAKRWRAVMNALRAHPGPVVITARLALVMVMQNGKPTNEKQWKVEGHKTLPFDVSAIVQMQSRSEVYLTGVRSMRWKQDTTDLVPLNGFKVEDLWVKLGLAESTDRVHNPADGATSLAADSAARKALLARLGAATNLDQISAWWATQHGHPITETEELETLSDLVSQAEDRKAERDNAPAEAEVPPSDLITEAQQRKMRALLAECGLKDREAVLEFASQEAGRTVTTSTDLTKVEAGKVIDALEKVTPGKAAA